MSILGKCYITKLLPSVIEGVVKAINLDAVMMGCVSHSNVITMLTSRAKVSCY